MNISKEKLLVVVGRVIDMTGNIIFLKLLTSLASKDDVGVYLLASSLVAMIMTISFSPLDQGFFRNVYKYKEAQDLGRRFISILFLYLCAASGIAILVGIIIKQTELGSALTLVLLPLILWIVIEPIKNANVILATGLRERGLLLKASTVDYALKISIIYLLHDKYSLTAASIIGILFLSATAQSALILWSKRKLFIDRISLEAARTTIYHSFQFAWPMVLWGGFGWLQNMSNRWMINHHSSTTVVAEYGIIVAIASMPFNALIGMVGMYIQPILYQDNQSDPTYPHRTVKAVTLKLIPITMLMIAVAAVFSVPLVTILTSNKYTENAWALPIIASAVAFNSICTILTYAIFTNRKTPLLIAANVIPGIFSIAFGYLLIEKFGFNGAVFTFILSNTIAGLLYVIAYFYSSRYTP